MFKKSSRSISYALSSCKRRLNDRHKYSDARAFVLLFIDSFIRFSAPVAKRLRGKQFAISVEALKHPIYLRLGTSDGAVFEEIFIRQVYLEPLEELSQPVRTILDLGANVGLSVAYWHSHFPEAEIAAVEPDPDNYAVLMKNTSTNCDTRRTYLFNACVTANEGLTYLRQNCTEESFSLTKDSSSCDVIKVTGLSVEAVIRQSGIEGPIDLLKCDIEGAEEEIFASCSAWIHRVRNIVIELHGDYSLNQFLECLEINGAYFTLVWQREVSGNLLVAVTQNLSK